MTLRSGDTKRFAATDHNGSYLFRDLPWGRYAVRVEGVGLERYDSEVTLNKGEAANLDIPVGIGFNGEAAGQFVVVVAKERYRTEARVVMVVCGEKPMTNFRLTAFSPGGPAERAIAR